MGDGTFRFTSQAGHYYEAPSQFAYGDFNGDGNLDTVFTEGGGNHYTKIDRMQVWLGDGAGKFSPGPTTTAYSTFGLVAVGDFNQDGKLDLFTSGANQAMFLGNGDGTFRHLANYPLVNLAIQMVAGDFNGDGKLDVVLLGGVGGDPPTLTLWFLAGNGDGTFQPVQQIYSSSTSGCSGPILQVSDFNGDGKLDIAFCNSLGQVGVMLGNGDGTFQAPIVTNTNAGSLFAYSIGDINCDGKPDLLVGTFDSGPSPQILVFLGNGDGTFQQTQAIDSVSAETGGFTLGDFNRDGLLDISVDNAFGPFVYLQQ